MHMHMLLVACGCNFKMYEMLIHLHIGHGLQPHHFAHHWKQILDPGRIECELSCEAKSDSDSELRPRLKPELQAGSGWRNG